jgi:hypothetical protein
MSTPRFFILASVDSAEYEFGTARNATATAKLNNANTIRFIVPLLKFEKWDDKLKLRVKPEDLLSFRTSFSSIGIMLTILNSCYGCQEAIFFP